MTPLSRGARRAASVIAWYEKTFDQAYPSQKTIAGKLRISLRTAKYWIAELRKAGIVEITHRPNRTSVYQTVAQIPGVQNCTPVCTPVCTPSIKSSSDLLHPWAAQRKPPRKANASNERFQRMLAKAIADDLAEEQARAATA